MTIVWSPRAIEHIWRCESVDPRSVPCLIGGVETGGLTNELHVVLRLHDLLSPALIPESLSKLVVPLASAINQVSFAFDAP